MENRRQVIGLNSGNRALADFFEGPEFALRRFCRWLNGPLGEIGSIGQDVRDSLHGKGVLLSC